MTKYDESILKVVEAANNNWITTKELDAILLKVWGNEYDAGMCCNSMMRHGYIDYHSDGDWQVFLDLDEVRGLLQC